MLSDTSNEVNQFCQATKMLGIFSIPPVQFAALASLLGVLLTYDLDADEQNSLGNFFLSVGQIIVTVASQKAIFESKPDNQQIIEKLNAIKRNVKGIEQELDRSTKK